MSYKMFYDKQKLLLNRNFLAQKCILDYLNYIVMVK